MYKPIDKLQHSFLDFNQPLGLHMNPDNRWIKLADRIPWDTFEVKYAELFPSDTGNVAKPLRMALGALIIQTKFQYSDRELVEQIAENPYLQYFIGLPGFREEAPFDASTLVLFRKRISAEMRLRKRTSGKRQILRLPLNLTPLLWAAWFPTFPGKLLCPGHQLIQFCRIYISFFVTILRQLREDIPEVVVWAQIVQLCCF